LDAREQLLIAAAAWLDAQPKQLSIREGRVYQTGHNRHVTTVAKVMERLSPHMIQGHGGREANNEDISIRPFGAQGAEVEVDIETGEVTVLRVVSAPDCGRILSPKQAESQVIGGVTQGVGYALMEERLVDERLGVVLNADLEEYKIATVADIPQITHAEVNLPDLKANPTGAKGLGELPLIPVAPAIVNAVYDACGVRVRDLPLTRAKLLAALARLREDGMSHEDMERSLPEDK
jgi:xanthine dehydrogenase YagR molybdenum-binding subunit